MKRKASSQKLELKVSNLSPAGNNHQQGGRSESPKHSGSSSPSSSSTSLSSESSSDMSIESSCVSSEAEETTSSSPERPAAPMSLVGCPRCLMYVMLSEVDPKCPQCKSTVFLDFLGEENSRKPN